MGTYLHNEIKVKIRRCTLTVEGCTEKDRDILELERIWDGKYADEPLCRALIEVIDHYNNSDKQERDAVVATLNNISAE